jgi:hypothetical protein
MLGYAPFLGQVRLVTYPSAFMAQAPALPDKNAPSAQKPSYEAQDVISTVPIWKWALAGGAVIGLAWIFRKKLGILNL